MTVRLHINIDHVATLRQARGTEYPDPVQAATMCERAGAHGITAHLREDRRHIQDEDVVRLRASVTTLLNLEMAATEAMVRFAVAVRPDIVTLVPEKREERTTEGGLDVVGAVQWIASVVQELERAGIRVSLFVDPDLEQIDAAQAAGARMVELHTGDYANASAELQTRELQRLARAATHCVTRAAPMLVAAGHGLTVDNVGPLVRTVPAIEELNIGHAVVSDAVMVGLAEAVARFHRAISAARA